ncbi:MAG: DUF3352 domain-containing protein [Anaerolineae bacterium]|nr:DUF3352 domain-containing protein [Anaerolineae bacterium]
MVKRVMFLVLVVALLSVFPVAAQAERTAADFVPADFAGFIRLRVDNNSLRSLNILTFVSAILQPQRVGYDAQNGMGYEDFMPFSTLFDVEETSFETNVLPWLDGELVLAYQQFDAALQISVDDLLIILPTENLFNAAAAMSAVINGQDLPTEETYRTVLIYVGDQAAVALTSRAVFIGGLDAIKAALDVQAEASPRLTDTVSYQTALAAAPEDPLVWGYVAGDYLMPALNGLLNGVTESEALLVAFGGALSQMRTDTRFETLLLNGGFDSAGVGLSVADNDETLHAALIFHAESAPSSTATTFDDNLLSLIPRNTLLAQSGTDLSGFLYTAMTAMPLSNFAREIFGGLPIQTVGTGSDLIDAPTAEDVINAVNAFTSAISRFDDFDLEGDLLAHLHGNYALALLPRPNNPVPFLNTPFDLLVVTQATDAEAASAGITHLLGAFYNLQPRELEALDGWALTGLAPDAEGDPVFILAVKDNLFILSTGEAAASAIAAERGDDRLIEQDSWQTLSEIQRPDLYLDANVFYNTFFPSAGGQVSNVDNRVRVAATAGTAEDGIYKLDVTVTVPLGN